MNIQIRESDIATIVALSEQIPEFAYPYRVEEYEKRLNGVQYLILTAYVDEQPAGFKVGYDRYGDGSFYSWMGAVHPEFRRLHLARKLADYQHRWAREQGYECIRMTTRNRLKPMLIFALSDGFMITGFRPQESLEEGRIDLVKFLR